MDRSIFERYLEKLQVLDDTLKHLNTWNNDIASLSLSDVNTRDKFAIFHAYQIIVETVTDITAMIVKDIGKMPKDDYMNFDILIKSSLFPQTILKKLKQANGLRYRIVHEYNGLIEKIAFEAINEHVELFQEFQKVVSEWLKKK